MSTIKVDSIATRTGSGNITLSNSLASATIAGDLAVDTNVLKVDSTNNKVGINVTSPDAMLQVQNGDITVGWADNFIGAQFQTGSDFRLGMKFGTVARTTKIVAETNDNNGEITFETNGSERARISNAGLHLGGTGAANALDDYEEGTWTPSVSNSSAYPGTRTGLYTKVGRVVTIQAQVIFTQSGTSFGGISGFPFALAGSSEVPVFIKEYQSNGLGLMTTVVQGNSNTNNFRSVVGNSLAATNGQNYGFTIMLTYKTS